MQKEPIQLEIDFSERDQWYYRQHTLRDIRTVPELISDAAKETRRTLVDRSLLKGAAVCIAIAVSAGAGYKYHDELEENRMFLGDSIVNANPDNYVHCPAATIEDDSVQVDIGEYQPEFFEDLFAARGIGSWQERDELLIDIKIAPTVEEAGEVLTSYLANKGIELIIEKDGVDSDGVYHELTVDKLYNLAEAVHTIPRSLYDFSNSEIRLVPFIEHKKSNDQKAHDVATYGKDTSDFSQAAGMFSRKEWSTKIAFSALSSYQYAFDTVLHEVVGHGVLMRYCMPTMDKEWKALNDSTGMGFDYLPDWKRNDIEQRVFESGVLFCEAYGGTNENEDVATCTDSLAGMYKNRPLRGNVDQENGTIIDEKQRLILERLKVIEPQIEYFVLYWNWYNPNIG